MRRAVVLFLVVFSCLCLLAIGASCTQPTRPELEVSPSSGTLSAGQVKQLVVTRHYPGGPIDVVTDRVRYVSSNRNIAAVSEKGEVTAGQEVGPVIIRITDPSSEAITSTTFVVGAPHPYAMEIAPAPAAVLRPGTNQRFTAMARFDNGVVRDVTSQVTWASSNEGVAIVGKAAPDFGVVTAISAGESLISATDPTTNVQARATVFVRGEGVVLEAVVVTPNPAELTVGQTVQFAARGVFSDGSTQDLTNAVAWASAQSTIVSIDASGRATGVAAGETTITASSTTPSAGDAGVDDAGSDAGEAGAPSGGVIRGSALTRVQ